MSRRFPKTMLLALAVSCLELPYIAAAAAPDDRALSFQERLGHLTAIHPGRRLTAAPSGGIEVAVNPPPLLWPTTSGSQVRYAVRLSQDANFPSDATTAESGLRWALFNAHKELTPGVWYWQVASRTGRNIPASSHSR